MIRNNSLIFLRNMQCLYIVLLQIAYCILCTPVMQQLFIFLVSKIYCNLCTPFMQQTFIFLVLKIHCNLCTSFMQQRRYRRSSIVSSYRYQQFYQTFNTDHIYVCVLDLIQTRRSQMTEILCFASMVMKLSDESAQSLRSMMESLCCSLRICRVYLHSSVQSMK